MTLRHLRIFVIVADMASMTAAAKELYISQPTVSQAISELESFYGVRFFDRLSKRLYLTEKGKQLLNYSRHIIALSDEMEQSMKNPDQGGIIKLGASLTIGTYLLPKLTRSFTNQYSSMRIQAVIKNTQEIEELIMKNKIDFGLVEGVIHNRDIVGKPFIEDELIFICGRRHPLYGIKSIFIHDLNGYDYIVREQGSGTRELFEKVMTDYDIKWNLVWECNGFDSIISSTEDGIGIAVISKHLVEKKLQSGELFHIQVENLRVKRKFSIIHHKNKFITDMVQSFFAQCMQCSSLCVEDRR